MTAGLDQLAARRQGGVSEVVAAPPRGGRQMFEGRAVAHVAHGGTTPHAMSRLVVMSRRRGVISLALLIILVTVCFNTSALGQRQRARSRERSPERKTAPDRAAIDTPAPLLILFQRTEEGVSRRDWKFAIDSLQRIIEDQEGGLLLGSADVIEGGVHFESARRRAARRLGQLPPEGLHAYHVLYDGVARGLLARAKESHHPAGLWTIMERYPLTSSAAAAADLISSWALDAGRPAEVIAVLESLRDVSPDPQVLDERSVAKLVAAYAMLGRVDRARAAGFIPRERNRPEGAAPVESVRGILDLGRFVQAAACGSLHCRTAQTDACGSGPWCREPVRWPMAGGMPSRRCVMPAVDPTLTDMLPWRFSLPYEPGAAWERFGEDGSSGMLELPAFSMVADEARLFVRTSDGCAALDIQDLHPIWRTHGPAVELWEGTIDGDEAFRSPADGADQTFGESGSDWNDSVASAISVAHGLVMVIEEPRIAPTNPFRLPRPRGPDLDGAALLRPNRVIARDVYTGRIVWELGGTRDFADPLGHAVFRSVPLEVDDVLWVPYFDKKDLYAAVIDPDDGSLLRSILLCSIEQPWLHLNRALDPAYAHGLVFVPTQHGMLLAIDADELILRWAVKYLADESGVAAIDGSRSAPWHASPPVVAGGWVLLALPPLGGVMGGSLVAFDAASGSFGWSSVVDGTSYILAANDERVWLGGRSIASLSLADGRTIWQTPLSAVPSGHAVLSGRVVYAPTYDGLMLVDSKSGNVLETRPLSVPERPLGNLLCLHSAMFNRDSEGVRKLPDISKLRTALSARQVASSPRGRRGLPGGIRTSEVLHGGRPLQHESDASDAGAALQLAWLELLEDHPRRALEILDGIRMDRSKSVCEKLGAPALPGLGDRRNDEKTSEKRVRPPPPEGAGHPSDPSQTRSKELVRFERDIAHARVEALLSLAADTSETAPALALLDQAGQTARTAADRLRCGISRAERQLDAGQSADAFRTLLDLGMSKDASHFIRIGRNVKAAARLEISQRLDAIKPRLAPAQAAAVEGVVTQRVQDATNRPVAESHSTDDHTLLRAVTELPSVGSAQQRALLELGARALKYAKYEQSEQLLAKCIQVDADSTMTAAALMLLCHVYQNPGQELIDLLHARLSLLGRRFAGEPIPDVYAAYTDEHDEDRAGLTIDEWVGHVRSIVPEAPTGWYSARVTGTVPSGLHGSPELAATKSWWIKRPSADRRRQSGTVRPARLATFALPDDVTRALGLLSGSDLVPRLVRLAGEHTGALEGRIVSYIPGDWILCHDAMDGRLLWHTQLRLPGSFLSDISRLPPGRESRPRRGVIDGQTAILSGERGLFGIGLATGRRLWVRRYDGSGATNEPLSRDSALACSDGLVAAMPRTGYLTLMRSADGSTVWERHMRGELVDHIWMRNGSVVTADQRLQRVSVFDAKNGSLTAHTRFGQPNSEGPPVRLAHVANLIVGPDCSTDEDAIIAVSLDDRGGGWRVSLDKPLGQLYEPDQRFVGVSLLGGDTRIIEAESGEVVFNERLPDGRVAQDGRLIDGTLVLMYGPEAGRDRLAGLVAFDIATGETLWQRDDLVGIEGSAGSLRVVGGFIPAVVVRRDDTDKPVRSIALALIDFRTGEEVGPAAELHVPGARPRYNGDCEIRSNAIVVGTTDGLLAFPVTVRKAETGGDS